MKNFIVSTLVFYLLLLTFIACAPTVSKIAKPPEEPPSKINVIEEEIKPPERKEKRLPFYGTIISTIRISKDSFNPSQKEEIALSYTLLQDALITMKVYDPDHGLIKTVEDKEWRKPGDGSIIWDGKDLEGKTVPDEAYYFTLRAENREGKEEIYDPTIFSGGIERDIINVDIDKENYAINYRLPQAARVLIRIGTEGGPLLKTLTDWEPRVAGAITEYWNGKDENNIIRVYDHPKFKMIVTYFTLPENSVITYGNQKIAYREYKELLISNQPIKPERERTMESTERVSHHYRLPRTQDYSPALDMSFPNAVKIEKDGTPVLKDKTIVRVELKDKDKRYFTEQQYEVTFFLDTEFYAEEEVGYSPYNWTWNLTDIEPGEHIVTVNLSSFKDQIGMLSRKVRIIK
ncbi:MAG: hypothetical protein ACMUIP_05715 [bacterium]